MKILITGGAGFLGLHLANYLAKKGFKTTLLDISDFAAEEYPKQCRFVKGDARNRELMISLSKGQDAIIHAAAALPLWRKEDIYDINIGGTKNLLESVIKNKIGRFVYISSTAVYGIPQRHPIFEDDRLQGVGPYGESKIESEKLCQKYRGKGTMITIIRPKTFVGTHRLGVFEILFDWIRDGKRIPVIGTGDNRYQLLDVDDLVEAIYRIIRSKKTRDIDTAFNIGAEKFGTVRKDLEELFEYAYKVNLGSRQARTVNYSSSEAQAKSRSKIFPTPAFLVKKALWLFEKLKLSPLYQWVYDTADKDSYVSIDRLIDTLKWRPRYSNSQALIKSYKWYLDHYDEIKSLPAGVTHRVGWKQGILGFFKRFL